MIEENMQVNFSRAANMASTLGFMMCNTIKTPREAKINK